MHDHHVAIMDAHVWNSHVTFEWLMLRMNVCVHSTVIQKSVRPHFAAKNEGNATLVVRGSSQYDCPKSCWKWDVAEKCRCSSIQKDVCRKKHIPQMAQVFRHSRGPPQGSCLQLEPPYPCSIDQIAQFQSGSETETDTHTFVHMVISNYHWVHVQLNRFFTGGPVMPLCKYACDWDQRVTSSCELEASATSMQKVSPHFGFWVSVDPAVSFEDFKGLWTGKSISTHFKSAATAGKTALKGRKSLTLNFFCWGDKCWQQRLAHAHLQPFWHPQLPPTSPSGCWPWFVKFRTQTRQLSFTWIWANRPSSKNSKLFFLILVPGIFPLLFLRRTTSDPRNNQKPQHRTAPKLKSGTKIPFLAPRWKYHLSNWPLSRRRLILRLVWE